MSIGFPLAGQQVDSRPLRPPPVQRVWHPVLDDNRVVLRALRLDLMHPQVHGNKWFKLKYNLEHLAALKAKAVLSFGGAYSNHLYALAAATRQLGIRSIGVVRGEIVEPLNPLLAFARRQGMELVSLDRQTYRRKHEPAVLDSLQRRFGPVHILPEGGSNDLALRGCAEIAAFLTWSGSRARRVVALPCATGATLAGLLQGISRHRSRVHEVLGVSVLKAGDYPRRQVAAWLSPLARAMAWDVLDSYHFGGYARRPPELLAFIEKFSYYNEIPIEPVYTGKLFFGLIDAVAKGRIAPASEVLAIHTGGILPAS